MSVSLDNLTNPAESHLSFLDESDETSKDLIRHGASKPSEGSSVYLIPVGKDHDEQDRLGALEAIFNDATMEFLKSQELPASGKFLDIGCAHGGLTNLMVKNFPQFDFVAIDNSEKQIAQARENSKSSDDVFIDWLVCDVYDMEKLKERHPDLFNVVFCRFILSHQKDPVKAVRHILEIVRPGGILIIQEMSLRTKFVTTKMKALESWGKMCVLQHRLQGSHKDTSEKVFLELATTLKVSALELKYFNFPMETPQQKSLFRRGVEQGLAIIPNLPVPGLMEKLGYEDGKTWLNEIRVVEENPKIKCRVKDFACIAARVT